MRILNFVSSAAVMMTVLAASAFGQGGEVGGVVDDAPALTKQERIAQVVAELNARAAGRAAPIGPSVTGGEAIGERGPAAVTIEVANRGLDTFANCPIDVALVKADNFPAGASDDVVAKLLTHPCVVSVTTIDANALTPTLSDLRPFDAVMTFSDATYIDPVALGDVFADYVDAGGGLVLALFAMNEGAAPSRSLMGRFSSDNYYCIENDILNFTSSPASLGTVHVPGHPVMHNVSTFSAPINAFRVTTLPHPRATRVADWDTGEVLVAARDDLAGRRVDLGFFPVSSDGQFNGWDATTDGALLMGNALVYAAGCPDVGLRGCGASIYRQGPNTSLTSRNSNTPANVFGFQQIADDFTLPGGAIVRRITVWGAYFGLGARPVPAIAQRFVVNIHADAGGLPGPIIYTTAVYAEPEWTGFHNFDGNRVYRFTLDLDTPFETMPGVTYWLSPLGDNNEYVWSWQFRSASGNRATLLGLAGLWAQFGGEVAFELCGFCDCLCPGDADFDGDVDLDDLQLLLFNFGFTCL